VVTVTKLEKLSHFVESEAMRVFSVNRGREGDPQRRVVHYYSFLSKLPTKYRTLQDLFIEDSNTRICTQNRVLSHV